MKGIAETTVNAPTRRNAGTKEPAPIGAPLAATVSSTAMAPIEMPTDSESCWATLVSVVARLIRSEGTSEKARALTLVN